MIKFQGNNVLVHSVSPVIEIESRNGGQPFLKRELIIDDSWDKDGRHFANFVLIEFTGDSMSQLDTIYPGMRVNVEGMLNGREYNNRIFNTVRGRSVAPYQPPQQAAPMPGGYPQPAPAYPQQQPAQTAAPTYPQQTYGGQQSPGVADLPFQR